MEANEDLEDGEIEDDDDEDASEATPEKISNKSNESPESKADLKPKDKKETADEKKKRHDKKKLTEAEKSVMRLHKIERLEREKRDKYRRQDAEEDYATTLEKAIASVLKKDKPPSGDEEKEAVEEKRGKKRKKKDKHGKKSKKNKQDSPKTDEIDENEMLNIRGGSPEISKEPILHTQAKTDEESGESDSSSSKGSEKIKDHRGNKKSKSKSVKGNQKRKKKYRERSKDREKWNKGQSKRNTGVCLYFLQGMCSDEKCHFSHESIQPMKLELCKFYMLECCAKGDKCLYMHSDFPCKFYHTGIPCPSLENCKFTHGGPLSDPLKQILYKHIETAPKEILGNFPRLSRENASVMINQAQGHLIKKYGSSKKDKEQDNNGAGKASGGIPSLFDVSFNAPPDVQQMESMERNENSKKENKRNRPSRWQDPDPNDLSVLQEKQKALQMQLGFSLNKSAFKDQDMRVNSNGDVDMRSLGLPQPQQTTIHPTNIVNPNILAQAPQTNLISNLLAQTQQNLIVPTNLFSQQQATLQNVINSAVLLNQQQQQNNQNIADANTVDIEKYKIEAGLIQNKDTDIRNELDIRPIDKKIEDVDHRKMNHRIVVSQEDEPMDEPENNLQIVLDEQKTETEPETTKTDYLETLPKTQRDLFMRIQAQQKENLVDQKKVESDNEESNINWYSDDEDDHKLTIKDDFAEEQSDADNNPLPAQIKPLEMIEKLGDLSKIDISAEVTKLLSTISQTSAQNVRKQQYVEEVVKNEQNSPKSSGSVETTKSEPKVDPRVESKSDPRSPRGDPRGDPRNDPRKSRLNSNEEKPVSIYDQTNLADAACKDVDLRHVDLDLRIQLKDTDLRTGGGGGRPDIDLRQMGLPFKAMQNYTPASEIDASISSHPPIAWRVAVVEIPKPDYTGLKLSATEAETTGDPRLRQIFRLSIEEKESPASPKESPKPIAITLSAPSSSSSSSSSAQARVDPRRRKLEAEQKESIGSGMMTYAQQLSLLQSSPFYQTLTSNQKLTLNQELATKNDQSGQNDPIIMAMLHSLGLVPSQVAPQVGQSQALNILANISQLGFPPGGNQQQLMPNVLMGGGANAILPPQIANQGILGAGPGLPNLQNMPPEFAINFDPRNGGLLGNGPPPFGNFPPDNFNVPDGNNFGNNFNDDFFPPDQQGGAYNNINSGNNNSNNNNRERGFRDRPRRGGRNNNNNHRNNRNFFRRNNRNRNNSPP